MNFNEKNDKLQIWLEYLGKVFVVESSPPNYQVDCVYRHLGGNSYEISSFDMLEPIDQMKVMRTLREVRTKCQDQ